VASVFLYRSRFIQLALSLPDDHRADCVSDHVDETASHRHKALHAEKESEPLYRQRSYRGQRRGEDHEAGAGDPAHTFRRDHHDGDEADLLRHGKINSVRLRDE